ncbi:MULTISPECIES: tyrosine-type recombinase/integrase [Streptomyces]|uniref:tyrosine-type recombinase/integrase n=1 Tax=Streptomyces TaxID=1883 RepID=UPI001C2E58DA|nr:site-specific integrase [Streptomyces sp. BV333]MBV1957248.1 site-specific integrase [Streptomyces sp. BV333]
MTSPLQLVPAPASDLLPARAERLRELIRPETLEMLNWDETSQVLRPSPDHPFLGMNICARQGCWAAARKTELGLCSGCRSSWKRSGKMPEEFLATEPKQISNTSGGCGVPKCQRPWTSSRTQMCMRHRELFVKLGRPPLKEFLAHSRVRPLPGHGLCSVNACHRHRANGSNLCCPPHWVRWKEAQARGTDFEQWCRTEPGSSETTAVSLRGLPALVTVEVLYALQARTDAETKSPPILLRALVQRLREQQVPQFDDVEITPNTHIAGMANGMRRVLAAAVSTPELEQIKDVWNMGVFGLGQWRKLDFTPLHQEWMRRACKTWVLDEIPRRYGKNIPNSLSEMILCVRFLSQSLVRSREDRGENMAALGRRDIEAFTQYVAHLKHTGEISAFRHTTVCRFTGRFLREIRDMGLTRPGEILAELPDDFALRRHDMPPVITQEGPGRALPREILTQLCERLPALDQIRDGTADMRHAIEVLIDTGRRPDEIGCLPWDCLETDEHGKSVLVYTDFKNNRTGCRLPIPDSTAQIIVEQKKAIRARFPDTEPTELVLFPRPRQNSGGTQPYRISHIGNVHRRWVNAMPPLLLADGTEFPKLDVAPYSYRHSYAQRHADAGTLPDVLRELMGHRSLQTTQTYYRVTEKRTRAAVDMLVSHQFDRRGNRIWTQARQLLEHEHARLRIGQVSVPYGICVEPTNVKAGGHGCPFRFRCVGCDHFRTDPSYLPELRAYLDTLLRDRERLAAATELDDWARTESTPSEEEIKRIRTLIRRVESDLEGLTDDEREQVKEATRTLRKTRTVSLGMPGTRAPEPNLRLERDA